MALKPGLRMTPDPQSGGRPPCRPSKRSPRSHQGRPEEAGSVPQRRLLVWEMCGLGRPEGSRRCTAAGERVSVAAGADSEEYWTLRLNGQGCLMCSPAKHNTVIDSFCRRDRVPLVFWSLIKIVRYKPAQLWVTNTDTGALVCDSPCCAPTCLCRVCARPSLGERDCLVSHDGSRLRSSELQRDTSGDNRWRRSLDRPLS